MVRVGCLLSLVCVGSACAAGADGALSHDGSSTAIAAQAAFELIPKSYEEAARNATEMYDAIKAANPIFDQAGRARADATNRIAKASPLAAKIAGNNRLIVAWRTGGMQIEPVVQALQARLQRLTHRISLASIARPELVIDSEMAPLALGEMLRQESMPKASALERWHYTELRRAVLERLGALEPDPVAVELAKANQSRLRIQRVELHEAMREGLVAARLGQVLTPLHASVAEAIRTHAPELLMFGATAEQVVAKLDELTANAAMASNAGDHVGATLFKVAAYRQVLSSFAAGGDAKDAASGALADIAVKIK